MGKKDKTCWIGFDLGGTKMLAQVYDADFNVLGQKRKKTKGHEGREAGLQRICATLQAALDEADVSADAIAGIGVGCPGPLDLDRGIIHNAPNLGWKDVHLKETLETAFKAPAVISNDVDAGVYGEYAFGAGQGAHCVFGIFPGTGIGGGCVYDGRIMRGKEGSCMEIGHVQVMPDGPLCGCGRHGCLEAVASRLSISAAAAAAAYRGDAPHLLAEAGMDLSNIRSGMLRKAVKAGDRVVEEILRASAEWIGVGISIAVHLLMPDVVVLGGGLVESMPDLYLKTAEASARKHVMESYRDTFKVAAAQLGDDATACGAAAWARTLLED